MPDMMPEYGLNSSENELCSSFSEEARLCQAMLGCAVTSSGMNCVVQSLKKSRHSLTWPDSA